MKQFYFAPLEGITTYIYRNLHHQKFGSMDKYFTPFVSPTSIMILRVGQKRM